jgi:hypothetical protein
MVGAVEIDDPKIGDTPVGGDVGGVADVDDVLAIGRDLRVGGGLHAEEVQVVEAAGKFLGGESGGG